MCGCVEFTSCSYTLRAACILFRASDSAATMRAGIIRAWPLFEETRYLVARMSPTFNTSSDTQHFKCGNALEIQH